MCFKFLILQFVLIATLPATAERMDVDTHGLLITKLEQAMATLPKNSAEQPAIVLRLADLYADRARLQVLARQDQNCAQCPDGSRDRQRAIELYNQVMERLNHKDQGSALLQLAHLQGLQNHPEDSAKTLRRATNAKLYGPEVSAKAHSGLGEIDFRAARYKSAESHFLQALRFQGLNNQGFVYYRLAWSRFNQGHFPQATETLIRLLQTPEYLTVQNQEGVVFDQSFHDDVTRDLVLFLARGDVGAKQVELLLSLTPEEMRKSNLHAFATELERLGKKSAAAIAWTAYHDEGDNTSHDQLETKVRMAQLQWDLGKKDQALIAYREAAELWRQKGCKGDTCNDLQKRFKNFVINWNRIEKDHPSRQCLEAYSIYLSAFKPTADLTFQAAQAAEKAKNHEAAAQLYAQAAGLAKQEGSDPKLLEASLLKQIESAELSGSKESRIKAYDNYLALNPKGQKALEVRYQKAQATYEAGRLESAFAQFTAIATESPADQRPLRLKSADLALDVLASLKDDARVYQWSEKLAVSYPERKVEYQKLRRRAAILLAAGALNRKDSDSGDLAAESDRLKNLDLSHSSPADQILILKNRLALAERRRDLNEVQAAADALLKVKGLSEGDREFALGRLVWVAELKLDFKSALARTKQMKLSHLKHEDRELRLAMLSELAGANPNPHYLRALQATHSSTKSQAIRTTLIRRSSRPWRELRIQEKYFRSSPQTFAVLVEEIYARDPDVREASKLLSRSPLNRSAFARLLARQDFLRRWQKQDRSISQHQLVSRSEALLKRTLTERVRKLNLVDGLGREALRSQDWSSQLVVLNTVARENQRLYDELLRLPVPRQLKGQDRTRYFSLLSAQAEPFRRRSIQAQAKLTEFWSNSKTLSELESAVGGAKGQVRALLLKETELLARIAPRSERSRLEAMANRRERQPSMEDLQKARRRLAQDPFDADDIKELKRLSEKRGETTMVAFLDARLEQMRKDANP